MIYPRVPYQLGLMLLLLFSESLAMPPKFEDSSSQKRGKNSSKRKEAKETPLQSNEGAAAADDGDARNFKKTPSSVPFEKGKDSFQSERSFPKGTGLYETFRKILAQEPEPLVDMKLDPITPQKEETEGSRRFVKSLKKEDQEKEDPKIWHNEASQKIESFRDYLKKEGFFSSSKSGWLPATTNMALGRISFFTQEGVPIGKIKEFPFVFLSGWPAKGVIAAENSDHGVTQLVQKLGEGKVTGFENYGIRYLTKDYTSKEPQTRCRVFDSFFEDIHKTMNQELEKSPEDRLLGYQRLRCHQKLTENRGEWSIQKMLYFHTEQAMRTSIGEAIEMRKKETITGAANNEYAIVDICSWLDMCWCCGDTLAVEAHLKERYGMRVYFRVSGMNAYSDFPFNEKSNVPLADKRAEFETYENPQLLVYGTKKEAAYKPFVAHVTKDDLLNPAKN